MDQTLIRNINITRPLGQRNTLHKHKLLHTWNFEWIKWRQNQNFNTFSLMGDDIGSDLSSMAVYFDFHSTKVVQLSNRNPYFYQFRCHHPLITQLSSHACSVSGMIPRKSWFPQKQKKWSSRAAWELPDGTFTHLSLPPPLCYVDR